MIAAHKVISSLLEMYLEESAVEQLKQRFPGASREIDQLVRHGLSGQGLRWAAKFVDDHPHVDIDNLAATVKAAKKRKFNLKHYDSLRDLRNGLVGTNTIGAPVKKQEATYLWDDGRYVVVHPHSKKAACHHGVNTSWCISRRDANNLWSHYNTQGYVHYFVIDSLATRTDLTRKVSLSFYWNDARISAEVTLADGNVVTRDMEPDDLPTRLKRHFPGLKRPGEVAKRIIDHMKEAIPSAEEMIDILAKEIEGWDKEDVEELGDWVERYEELLLRFDYGGFAEEELRIPTAQDWSVGEDAPFYPIAADKKGWVLVRPEFTNELAVRDAAEVVPFVPGTREYFKRRIRDDYDVARRDEVAEWLTGLWEIGDYDDKLFVRNYFLNDPHDIQRNFETGEFT